MNKILEYLLGAVCLGTYMGSPWGQIRGKVDDCVGGVWKGINWVRVRVLPLQRGTIEKYRIWKDDPAQPFSFKQFNLRRLVTQILGYIARFGSNKADWIIPVWGELVSKRGWIMTSANAFVRRNAAVLNASISNQAMEYDPTTNAPDLTKMLVSDGDLESAFAVTGAVYDTITGNLVVDFNASTFENGASDDWCQVIVAKKPLLEMEDEPDMKLWNWYPALHMYTFLPAPPAPAIPGERGDSTVTVALPAGLTATDLTAYLFFRDDAGFIGYSPSKALAVTPAP